MAKIEIKLNYYLEKLGMSRREFADKVKIRQGTINDLCSNKSKTISFENLAKILDELNIEASQLLIVKNKKEND